MPLQGTKTTQLILVFLTKANLIPKFSKNIKELPDLERRLIDGQRATRTNEEYSRTVYNYDGRRRIDINSSHSPLLRNSQVQKNCQKEQNELYKMIISGEEEPAASIGLLLNDNKPKSKGSKGIDSYDKGHYGDYPKKTEFGRSKTKNSRAISTKLGKSKVIEKRKGVSSPKQLARMMKKQASSLSNTSTPVNKTQSTSFKTRGFASRENEKQMKNYQKKLLQQSIANDPMEKGIKKSNLPTIKQQKVNGAPSLRHKAKNDSKTILGKDGISKKQRLKRDTTSGSQKNKYQTEYSKLKQAGDLKWMPKLLVDTPFLAKRIKFKDRYNETDTKWAHRFSLKEDFIRREQIKHVDKFLKNSKIVYDYLEDSPYYKDLSKKYIDDKLLLQTSGRESSHNNARFKMRGLRRNIMNTGLPKLDKIYTSLNPYYVLQGEEDTTLIFESRFESGNLRKAVQLSEFEYDLFLRNDYNSQGYIQWYFFKCSNIKEGVKYTFHLKNFFKSDSLYNQGMKPLIYSKKKQEEDGIGWYRGGENICYYQNNTKKKNSSGFMSTLTFEIEFLFDNDEVYLCHCFPFTYRDCKEHLESICNDNEEKGRINMKSKIRKTEMCKSLAGNSLDLVIITNFTSSELDISKRQAAIITGRVHPGESNSSFVVQGILDFLVGNTTTAIQLRDKYVFKIIPMLNPDGVILGNYRCSLSGQDLNRQWIGATSRMFPEIYNTKLMFKKTLESRRIYLYVDCHGHSRKKNAFMYGCKSNDPDDKTMKVFPYIMSESNGAFSFDDCNFNIQKDKESTGRVVVNREYNVNNSFTLEASFLGSDMGKYKGCHFTPTQLRDIGKAFCIALNESESGEVAESILETLNERKASKADE
ncbi:unnamed protein product [Moneuplotes crassus]|uniref:Peptidase M14 domain-containing protein n=1 Tax=Euplotes crassus TaxID=5936 RepID=A0AAD2D5R9_EUPCR|nr:unnamed protein product [Moneuplotes crassus]